jgi:hypothetical protein
MNKHPNALVYSTNTRLFPELSYRSFTYPGDEEALQALRSVPGAGALLAWLEANFTEQITYLNNNEQMIRVNANNYGSLHARGLHHHQPGHECLYRGPTSCLYRPAQRPD